MNLINFYVTEIISEPIFMYDKWFIDVMADSHGVISKNTIMFNTKEECLLVCIGYEFLS